jgi:integrase
MKRIKTTYPGVYYREGRRIGGPGTERIYYITFKRDGRMHEEKVGRQYQDAMTPAKAARMRAARIEGKVQSRKEKREAQKALGDRWTLERLWAEYKPHLSGHSLTTDANRWEKHIKPAFPDKEPAEILALDVERLKRKLLKKRAAGTVRNVLELLNRIINFGVKRGLCPPLPFHIQKPRVNNIKTEDLDPKQMEALFKAMDAEPNQSAANIMRMVLFTGMRRGELFKLKWEHVDFQRGFIRIVGPKGGVDQTIPMNEAARGVLEAQAGYGPQRVGEHYVFPGRNGGQRKDIKKPVNRIKKAAGLPDDFRPLHGLRHVYGSMLASSGQVDMYTIQKLMTHKSPAMTMRYAHLRDEALRRASDVVTDFYRKAENE